MPTVLLILNGTETSVSYEDGMHLLEVLREVCGLKSLKDGCAPQGRCGCCTVLIDGRPALACLVDPRRVAGSTVVTLEGLAEPKRRILAESFVDEGAIQCGFCTPGILMRAAWLLDRGLTSDRDRIARALAGHLCRCTGYTRIIDAIQTAGERWQGPDAPRHAAPRRPSFFGETYGLHRDPCHRPVSPHGVGASAPRHRGLEAALGEKPFVADLEVEGMLHAALVLADEPRAILRSLDTSAAEAAPGVIRVLGAEDVPGERLVGLIVQDWPVLVAEGETTRCVGDVLAVVVAETQHAARRAAALVRPGLEVLEPLTSPAEALAPDAPQLHPGGNLLETVAYQRGDIEAALAASAHVLTERFTTQRIEHAFLEPEACLAVPGSSAAEAGIRSMKIYSQGQGVHEDRRQIASILGIEPEQVTVELVTNGGAFGGKEDLAVQGQAALAAWCTGRPVRLVLTREQSLRLHPKRHPLELHYTVGADADGRLTAVRARIVGDTGAYASVGTKVLERAAGHACGPYRVPNVDIEARTVYTNNPPCGAMRGFGVNQAAFAIEGMLDRLAERVGIDGYEIRERNICDPGDIFATGQRMDTACGIRATLEATRDIYRATPRAGIACGIKNTGIGNGLTDIGRVLIRVLEGQQLEVLCGFTEMGQGLHTVLRQVIVEETGLDEAIISVRTVSDPRVECGMTTASRATALATEAGRRAARSLAEALATQSLDELAGRELLGELLCDITVAPGTGASEQTTHMSFGYATQVVLLDERGQIKRVVAAHDVGHAINPQLCAGQIEGAVHMGLGQALSEDFPCRGAKPVSLRLHDLGILKAADTPPVDVILIEVPDLVGGYGSKGVGEIGLVPTAAAVAAAFHAVDGHWRSSLPMAAPQINSAPGPTSATDQGADR